MQRTRDLIMARRRKAAGRSARRIWAVAATVVLTVSAAVWVLQRSASDVVVTDVGELRTLPLSDGSVVTLNTATEVRIHYSQTGRRIELLQGQASFEVAKDPARPFVVSAGGREVRALGTVFDVYKGKDKVTVTLIEGKVAVASSAGSPTVASPEAPVDAATKARAAPVVLNPGEQVSYTPTAMTEPLEPIAIAAIDVPRVTAWKARKLAFRDTLLTEAIAEANRYSHEQIVLEAPGMESARLSGSFEAGKNELFAEGLRTFFGLKVERQGDDRIVLTPTDQ
jgi:transmembrane sensor